MARGWESKSVEAQQQELTRVNGRAKLSALEIETLRRREGLELSKKRVTRELSETRSESRKSSLENALRHLDDELRKL
jgi:hypothetical protein